MLIVAAMLITFAVGAYYVLQTQRGLYGPPTAALQAPYLAQGSFIIGVASTTEPLSPDDLQLSLGVNGSGDMPVDMPPLSNMKTTIWTYIAAYAASWQDNDNNGLLSGGDTFTLTLASGSIWCCRTLTFDVLWKATNAVVAQVSFSEAPLTPPSVFLGTVTHGVPANAWIPIDAVSPPFPPGYFRIQLHVGPNVSGPVSIPEGGYATNFTVGGNEYLVAWYDGQYDGLLDGGDAFNVTRMGVSGPPPGTGCVFDLEWFDGSVLAIVSWTV